MIKLYDKIQDKEWEIINKVSEKSIFAGRVTAFAIGVVEGMVSDLIGIAVIGLIVKVVMAIRGRR